MAGSSPSSPGAKGSAGLEQLIRGCAPQEGTAGAAGSADKTCGELRAGRTPWICPQRGCSSLCSCSEDISASPGARGGSVSLHFTCSWTGEPQVLGAGDVLGHRPCHQSTWPETWPQLQLHHSPPLTCPIAS